LTEKTKVEVYSSESAPKESASLSSTPNRSPGDRLSSYKTITAEDYPAGCRRRSRRTAADVSGLV